MIYVQGITTRGSYILYKFDNWKTVYWYMDILEKYLPFVIIIGILTRDQCLAIGD
jgi:hypothetical protein